MPSDVAIATAGIALINSIGNLGGFVGPAVVGALHGLTGSYTGGLLTLSGALVIEAFEQASQLLIGATHDGARVGRLRGVSRATFRHFVQPGDQLRVRCTRTGGDDDAWVVSASGEVAGRRVASATLDFAIVPAVGDDKAHGERVRETLRVLRQGPLELRGAP